MSVAFLVTSLVIVATPGTGALYTISTGLTHGAKRSVLAAAFACTLGIVPHMIAAITGLAAVLHTVGVVFEIIKYLGVAYLMYMAWSTWRDHDMLRVDESVPAVPRRKVIRSGITINLLNPKLTIFFFAFLPQFVTPDDPHSLPRMIMLSAVFMAMTFVVFASYGALASTLRTRVLRRPVIADRIRKAFAASFLVLSARLAAETR